MHTELRKEEDILDHFSAPSSSVVFLSLFAITASAVAGESQEAEARGREQDNAGRFGDHDDPGFELGVRVGAIADDDSAIV